MGWSTVCFVIPCGHLEGRQALARRLGATGWLVINRASTLQTAMVQLALLCKLQPAATGLLAKTNYFAIY
jgi:hypothetical protein